MAAQTPDWDRTRFEQLFRAYGNLMFHVADGILHNEHDAEDAVQQAFFALLQHIEKISDVDCPQTRGFVVTIVERKAIDLYRSKQRRAVLPLEDACLCGTGTPEPDTVHARWDLAGAMAMLPPRYREVLLLKYDSGYSDREIAELCSMTVSNVKKTVQRAKKRLERILDGQEA